MTLKWNNSCLKIWYNRRPFTFYSSNLSRFVTFLTVKIEKWMVKLFKKQKWMQNNFKTMLEQEQEHLPRQWNQAEVRQTARTTPWSGSPRPHPSWRWGITSPSSTLTSPQHTCRWTPSSWPSHGRSTSTPSWTCVTSTRSPLKIVENFCFCWPEISYEDFWANLKVQPPIQQQQHWKKPSEY